MTSPAVTRSTPTLPSSALLTLAAVRWLRLLDRKCHDSLSPGIWLLSVVDFVNIASCEAFKRSVQAIYGNPSHNYGVSLAIWDHTVLPATRNKWTHPTSTPARQAGTQFTDHLRMEGWVSPGPGCKEQLAHGCYATARASVTRTHDLDIASRAR